jgi:hypothetical protein
MSSQKLEKIKQRHPGLSTLLDQIGEYIRVQIAAGQDYVVPKLAAAALQLNDGEAFVLLELLVEGNLLRRVYNVYCRKNDALLATVDNLDALDEVAHCDFCNIAHDPSDLRVEVAFSIANDSLKDLAA